MFKIPKNGSYTWPVTVEIPVSGGKFEKNHFDAEFKLIPQSAFRELLDKNVRDAEACQEVLVGWKGVQDENGNDLPYSEDARDRLLEVPLVAAAIAKAFISSYTGEAKRKN